MSHYRPDQKTFRRGELLPLIFAGFCLLWLSTTARSQETSTEYKLRVAVKSAAAHLEADMKSPVIAELPQGTLLSSYYSDGVWFRVVLPTGKEGIVLIGYVSRLEVDILEEKVKAPPDFWGQTPEDFRGLGIIVKLTGGLGYFGQGDIDKGAGGLFDQNVDILAASGYDLQQKDPQPFHVGPEAGLDIFYRLSSRLGVGLGGSFLHAKGGSSLQFTEKLIYAQSLWSVPVVDAIGIRLKVFYDLPLLSWLGLNVHGGPSFFHLNYDYSLTYSTTTSSQNYYQKAKADCLGFHGGLGLTFRINPQTAFVIEAQGRYARFTDLKGSEKLVQTNSQNFAVTTQTSGSVYYVEGNKYPSLAVMADGTAAGLNARKAVFDLSGLSLTGGLIVRF
jgi:hypothetical protein